MEQPKLSSITVVGGIMTLFASAAVSIIMICGTINMIFHPSAKTWLISMMLAVGTGIVGLAGLVLFYFILDTWIVWFDDVGVRKWRFLRKGIALQWKEVIEATYEFDYKGLDSVIRVRTANQQVVIPVDLYHSEEELCSYVVAHCPDDSVNFNDSLLVRAPNQLKGIRGQTNI